MITAAQLRAARGLIDWTRNELAKAANISPETVKNIEHGIFRPQEETSDRIVKTFAAHGVEFTDSEGVRIHKDTVTRYEGSDGFKRFMDDVYDEAKIQAAHPSDDKAICVSNVDDRLFIKHLGDYAQVHVERMNKLANISVKVLVGEKNFYKAPGNGYLEYRWHPKQNTNGVPFYVYGDKFAIIIFGEQPAPQVIVIASPLVAKAYRGQFEIIWQSAKA